MQDPQLPIVLVNKVLLAQGHTHPYTHHLWQLSGDKGRVEALSETLWPGKPKRFTVWPERERE